MNLAQMEKLAVPLGADRKPDTIDCISNLADYERSNWVKHWRNIHDSDEPYAADGLFYHDTREPFMTVPPTAVTLSTTAKALYTPSNFPNLGGQYFSRVGRKMKIACRGIITTAATPGNGSFNILYGTGADANGVALVTGTPVALVASQTNIMWVLEIHITCITTGSAGTLRCTGWVHFGEAVQSTFQALPATVGGVSGAVDLTAALIPSVQFLRSGSTAETMQILDMEVISLN